jgi:hypothetical protein
MPRQKKSIGISGKISNATRRSSRFAPSDGLLEITGTRGRGTQEKSPPAWSTEGSFPICYAQMYFGRVVTRCASGGREVKGTKLIEVSARQKVHPRQYGVAM